MKTTPIQRVCKRFNIRESELSQKEIEFLLRKIHDKRVKQLIETHYPNFHSPLEEYMLQKKGFTLKKCELIYGQERGREIFEVYREKHRFKNTLEGKKKKYGWTEEEFRQYNARRAVTLENLQNKYGEEEGLKRFNIYREKQAHTNTKEYLGERYEEINKQKGLTLPNFIRKYGEEGKKKYEEYAIKSRTFYSKKSQILFDLLLERFPLLFLPGSFYATRNGEYGVWSYSHNRFFKYDFVNTELKIAIEFHGDHYHGNPKIYAPDEFLRGRGMRKVSAKEAWVRDSIKLKALEEERGIETIVVWESDFDSDPETIIRKIYENCRNRKISNNPAG